MKAVQGKYIRVIEHLVFRDEIDVTVRDKSGKQAVDFCSEKDDPEIFNLLQLRAKVLLSLVLGLC